METETGEYLPDTDEVITVHPISELGLDDAKMAEFLAQHNAELMRIPYIYFDEDTWREEKTTVELIRFSHGQELPVDLPPGYCFIGGTARNVVLQELGERVNPPRDTDISAIEEFNPDRRRLGEIGEAFLGRDFDYGTEIKVLKLPEYFLTRDFAINQVLVHGNDMYLTAAALQDLLDKCITPTPYVEEKWYFDSLNRHGLQPSLVMKSLRLLLEFKKLYGKADIKDIPDWQFDFRAVPAFDIALGLNKAQELGDKVAESFYRKLLKLGTICTKNSSSRLGAASATELAVNIKAHVVGDVRGPFIYSKEEWNYLDPDPEADKYEAMANDYLGLEGHERIERY